MIPARSTVVAMIGLLLSTGALAEDDPLDVVNGFQEALRRGDGQTARALLAPDVLIYESGGQERSRNEYAGGHLAGDIAFMAGAKVEKLDQSEMTSADLAVVTTRSRLAASSKGKPVVLLSTETMVLRRVADRWQIAHIHWSSRPASAGK